MKNVLPIGTVCSINEKYIMIIGYHGLCYRQGITEFDYIAYPYPEGISGSPIYLNAQDIQDVIFVGYENDSFNVLQERLASTEKIETVDTTTQEENDNFDIAQNSFPSIEDEDIQAEESEPVTSTEKFVPIDTSIQEENHNFDIMQESLPIIEDEDIQVEENNKVLEDIIVGPLPTETIDTSVFSFDTNQNASQEEMVSVENETSEESSTESSNFPFSFNTNEMDLDEPAFLKKLDVSEEAKPNQVEESSNLLFENENHSETESPEDWPIFQKRPFDEED